MTTTKQYDFLNRLTQISSAPSGAAAIGFNYQYNDAGQRVSVTNADNSVWVYQYDQLGQVISGKRYWSDGTPVAGQQFEYGFDDIGNRSWAKAGGDASGGNLRLAGYSADSLNQYISRTVPGAVDITGAANPSATVTVNNQRAYRNGEYFRDELALDNSGAAVYAAVTSLAVLGNGTNADIVASATGNVFLPRTPEQFAYDLDGNLSSDGRWTYAWDAENRLVSMEALSTIPTGAKLKLDFIYDWQGRRIQKTVSTWNGSTYVAQAPTRFAYDGWNLVAILNPQSSILDSFVWGLDLSGSMQGAGGVGGLLLVNEAAQGAHFAAHDGNGNLAALVKAGDGTISAQYEYGPFGELVRATGPIAAANPFRFSTKYQDDETGLLYYGYRYYSPNTGRWLNRDPLGEAGGNNLYCFVFNDPADKLDHLGKNAGDLLLKIRGKQIPRVFGISAGGIAIAKAPWLPNIFIGLTSGVYFFPDSCEVAAFSIRAGLGNMLADWRLPTEEEFGRWYEAGLLVSIGAGFETAGYLGNSAPGSANASSFVGLFHTLQVGFTATGVPIGASVYFGDKDSTGGRWIGGTLGVGPGTGVAVIDWNYQIMVGPVTVKPKCLCYAAILSMP